MNVKKFLERIAAEIIAGLIIYAITHNAVAMLLMFISGLAMGAIILAAVERGRTIVIDEDNTVIKL